MASVHRDPRFPKGVFYCHFLLADGRRAARSTGKKNKPQAEIICQAWQQAENEAANGELTPDRVSAILNETLIRIGDSPLERISVKNWLEGWLASKDRVTTTTRRGYEQIVREFLDYLGPQGVHRRLEAITHKDIEGFARLLRKDGRTAATINKLLRKYLSAAFEKARKIGKIRYNPIMATEPEKAESLARHVFSGEQVIALCKAAGKGTDWEGLVLYAYGTGSRLGDAKSLRWSSLDIANGIVTFRQSKTGKTAIVALHPDFQDWIAERSVPEDDPDAYVFPTLAGRSLHGEHGLSNTFIELMAKAGIKSHLLREGNAGKGRSLRALSFHSLRHTAASNVFNSAALKEITRRVTAHAAGGVVDRYIHEDLTALREATKLIPRLPRDT